MIRKKSSIIMLISALLFIGCITIEPRIYDGKHQKPNSISVLYSQSNSRGIIKNEKDAGITMTKLTNDKGNIIDVLEEGRLMLKGKYELKPGKYILTAKWTRTIGIEDEAILSNGDILQIMYSGYRFLNSPVDKYKITFIARAGMTYVLDIKPTMKFLLRSPDKLCLTEEPHNAKGALGAKVTEDIDIRYPSNHAKIVACSQETQERIKIKS